MLFMNRNINHVILKICFYLMLVLFNFSAFAEISEQEEKLILEIFDFRLDLCCVGNDKVGHDQECANLCDKKLEEVKTIFQTENFSEESQLVITNILVQEKYNYLYNENPKNAELKPIITGCYDRTVKFANEHKNKTLSKYFYVIAGDVLSSSLQYLPLSKAMSEGMMIKTYYEAALNQDSQFSYALTNYGQWLYHAPSIAGGSKKKALEYFYKAAECAKIPFEQYYSNFLISQIELENKNISSYKIAFEKALAARQNNQYLEFVRKINDAGYSIFYYIPNREKVEKELNL